MAKKHFANNPIEDFYQAIADEDEDFLKSIHIPHSSVYYAREAYFQFSGEWISLEQMEEAMIAEGLLTEE